MAGGKTRAIEFEALDRDGTLLGRDDCVPPRRVEAHSSARAQGVQVILARGKTRFSALDVMNTMGRYELGVFLLSLVILHAAGTILREVTLSRELAHEALRCAEQPEMPHSIHTRDGLYAPAADV